jgi:hypothetical protein
MVLLLQSALQPLVGFGLLYDFVPQSSIFTLLSPVSHFHILHIEQVWLSHYIGCFFSLLDPQAPTRPSDSVASTPLVWEVKQLMMGTR